MLWVQEGDLVGTLPKKQGPVEIKLNGKTLSVAPSGFRSGMPVDEYLKVSQRNSLVLFPDERSPERKLKV
ncbi:hypothetical protein NL298_27595, partial [Klebsiella pneumoniae]|nr:hypothetical protein [Klebsiella pneumoniae]